MKEPAAIWRLPAGYTDLLSVATDFIISNEEFAWLARIGDGEAVPLCNQAASDSCQSAEKSSTSSSSFPALLATNDAVYYNARGSSSRSESFAADSTRAYGLQSLGSISTKKAEPDDIVLWALAPPEIQPFLGLGNYEGLPRISVEIQHRIPYPVTPSRGVKKRRARRTPGMTAFQRDIEMFNMQMTSHSAYEAGSLLAQPQNLIISDR